MEEFVFEVEGVEVVEELAEVVEELPGGPEADGLEQAANMSAATDVRSRIREAVLVRPDEAMCMPRP